MENLCPEVDILLRKGYVDKIGAIRLQTALTPLQKVAILDITQEELDSTDIPYCLGSRLYAPELSNTLDKCAQILHIDEKRKPSSDKESIDSVIEFMIRGSADSIKAKAFLSGYNAIIEPEVHFPTQGVPEVWTSEDRERISFESGVYIYGTPVTLMPEVLSKYVYPEKELFAYQLLQRFFDSLENK